MRRPFADVYACAKGRQRDDGAMTASPFYAGGLACFMPPSVDDDFARTAVGRLARAREG